MIRRIIEQKFRVCPECRGAGTHQVPSCRICRQVFSPALLERRWQLFEEGKFKDAALNNLPCGHSWVELREQAMCFTCYGFKEVLVKESDITERYEALEDRAHKAEDTP